MCGQSGGPEAISQRSSIEAGWAAKNSRSGEFPRGREGLSIRQRHRSKNGGDRFQELRFGGLEVPHRLREHGEHAPPLLAALGEASTISGRLGRTSFTVPTDVLASLRALARKTG